MTQRIFTRYLSLAAFFAAIVTIPFCFAQDIDLGAPYKFLSPDEMNAAKTHPQNVEIREFTMAKADPIFGEIKGEVPVFHRFIPVGTASFSTNYALLGEEARKELRDKVPTLVIINGGPAAASSGHLALAFDYLDPAKNRGLANRLEILNKYFNIVLVDQRGQGSTIPLAEYIQFDYERASKYNNEDVVAYDHAAVVADLIRRGLVNPDNWYLFGHSYGETPSWQMLKLISDGKINVKPKGVAVSAGTIPFEHELQWKSTRQKQIQVTEEIEAWSKSPESGKTTAFKDLIMKTRAKISGFGLNPEAVHLVYYYPVTGQDEKATYESLEKLFNDLNAAKTNEEAKTAYDKWVATEGAPGLHQQHMMFIAAEGMHLTDLLNKVGRLPEDIIDSIAGWEFEATYSPSLLDLARGGKIYMAPAFTRETAKEFLAKTDIKVVLHSAIDDNVSTFYRVREEIAKSIGAGFVVTQAPAPVTTHRAFYKWEPSIRETFEANMGLNLVAP